MNPFTQYHLHFHIRNMRFGYVKTNGGFWLYAGFILFGKTNQKPMGDKTLLVSFSL